MMYPLGMVERLVRLMLRLPVDLHATLVAEARREERSLNAQIVYLLRQALTEQERRRRQPTE